MNSALSNFHKTNVLLVLMVCLGLDSRLIILPFATTDSADPVSRVWSAWRWISNPELITHGVWGPLHTYLIALSMMFVRDPVVPPVLLHIFFSVATAIPLYFFTKNEFRSHKASMLVTFTYLFYPVAVSNSLEVTAESPFIFFLVLCLLFLSIARQDRGSWKHALGAGISLTLAGMLRYEGWMLIPLLGVLLWRKPKLMLIFLASSVIHPLFWMFGNGMHYGNPLYSINWASNWEINIEGANRDLALDEIVKRFAFYPLMTLLGLTPLVGIFCLAGLALSVIRRQSYAVWIIPFIGLMCLLVIPAVRGSLALKVKYTATLGTLLFPFSAELYKYLRISHWNVKALSLIGVLIVVTMILFSYPQVLNNAVLTGYRFPAISAIPRFSQQKETKFISSIVNKSLENKNEGFLCDFFGWQNSYYVALMTRLHPDNIFMAPGGKNQELDANPLLKFIEDHQSGIMLLNRDSRFSKSIALNAANQARIGDVIVSLKMVQSVSLRSSEINIYRYEASTM